MRRDLSTCSSQVCDASCWANTDYHTMLQQCMLNQQERTSTYALVRGHMYPRCFGSLFSETKVVVSSSSRRGGGNNSNNSSSSSSRTHEARVSVAIRSTFRSNPWTLSTCTCTVVLVFFVCFLMILTSKFGVIVWRREIHSLRFSTELFVADHYYYDIYSTASPAAKKQQQQQQYSRTPESRVSVAVRSACRSSPCTLCTRT